MIHGH